MLISYRETMFTKTRKIAGKTIQLYSRDGRNWSSNPDDLPALEYSANSIEPESPFWDLPDADPLSEKEDKDEL